MFGTAQDEFWNFIPDGDASTTSVFEWLDPDGNVIGTDPLINVCPTETSTYTARLTVTDNNTGETNILADEVTVDTSADFTLDIEGDELEFCDVESFDITANIDGVDPADADFSWSTGETTQTITVTETGTYTVIVTVDGCSLEDTISIIFRNSPVFELGADMVTCFENQIILDATPNNYSVDQVTFEWSQDGEVIGGENGPTLEIVESGNYSVIVNFEGCSSEDNISIIERDPFVITIDEDDFRACPGDAFTLTTTTEETDVTYQWFLNDIAIEGANDSTFSATITESAFGTQTYRVEISLGICFGEAEVNIDPYNVGNCVIGQGLSPNNDGFNDSLDLEFLSDRAGGIDLFQIFNRLGTLVFEQNNYVNQWVGQDMNGNELPTGTYFYIINIAENDITFGRQATGWIYINKEE